MENTHKNEKILAYDIGSTGLKAALYDFNGKVIASKYQCYETYYPFPTWAEQEPEEWWKSICIATREILKETGLSNDCIKAIAPVGHQLMAVPVDKNGNLLRKRIQYCFDTRSTKQAKELIERVGGYANFYRINGLGHPPEILSISKAMWLKENEPDLFNDTYKFLQSKSFIILNLTDKQIFVDDFGDASNTGWLDITEKKYSAELLEAAGINMSKMPEIRNAFEIIGYVGKEASNLTGLKKGTPIITGSGDVPASCIGAGIVEKNMHFCSIGSASWNGTMVDKPILNPELKMINVCHLDNGYISFQVSNGCSVSKDWFENSICDVEKELFNKIGIRYDFTENMANNSEAGSRGIFYIPNLRGGGVPHHNTNSRGALVGLCIMHNKNDIARSVLEGVALNFRWMVEQSKVAGIKIDSSNGIRIVGGGTKNNLWVQIYSDVLGTDFYIMQNAHEATAKGGFISAAIALKWYRSYLEAAKETVFIEKVISPNLKNHSIYNEAFPIFQKIYFSLEDSFNDIAKFRNKNY